MKTREQNRNNKRTEIERFDWFIERTQTRVAFGWLGCKNFMPENILEINRYLALLSYCNTIGQSNKAFSTLGFSFHLLIRQITLTETIFQGHTKNAPYKLAENLLHGPLALISIRFFILQDSASKRHLFS